MRLHLYKNKTNELLFSPTSIGSEKVERESSYLTASTSSISDLTAEIEVQEIEVLVHKGALFCTD